MIFRNPTFLEIEQIFEQLSSNKSRLSLEKEKNLKFMYNYFLIKPLYQYIKPFYFVKAKFFQYSHVLPCPIFKRKDITI